jgi:hypothetical protein
MGHEDCASYSPTLARVSVIPEYGQDSEFGVGSRYQRAHPLAVSQQNFPSLGLDLLGMSCLMFLTVFQWSLLVGIIVFTVTSENALLYLGAHALTTKFVVIWACAGYVLHCGFQMAYYRWLRHIWFNRLPGLVRPMPCDAILVCPAAMVVAAVLTELDFTAPAVIGLAILSLASIVVLWPGRVTAFWLCCFLWRGK